MKLFHAFPRPRHRIDKGGRVIRDPVSESDREKGFEILRLILTHGLLCTPERFRLYPSYDTENKEKQKFLKANLHHDELVQSRACFTLVDTLELSQAYELSYGQITEYVTHTELFGEFAIGLHAVEARELGIMPTVYYYRHDLGDSSDRIAGLSWQIIERLDEARTVFSVLSYLESWANRGPEDVIYPPQERLEEMGVRIRYQPEIEAELKKLTAEKADLIFRLFNTDRVPAWNMIDFLEILLSLYQTADSTLIDAPLAFFRQKEWRLIHHMTEHLRWFGLGHHRSYRNPWRMKYTLAIKELSNFIRSAPSRKSAKDENWYLDHCWVLAGSTDRHFRDFVREIVVPQTFVERTKDLLKKLRFESAPPTITSLPARWRIATGGKLPRIVTDS